MPNMKGVVCKGERQRVNRLYEIKWNAINLKGGNRLVSRNVNFYETFLQGIKPIREAKISTEEWKMTKKILLLLAHHLEVYACIGSHVSYVQDEMAYNLHPILCTWDAVTVWTPVTLSFLLGVRLCGFVMFIKGKKSISLDSKFVNLGNTGFHATLIDIL